MVKPAVGPAVFSMALFALFAISIFMHIIQLVAVIALPHFRRPFALPFPGRMT